MRSVEDKKPIHRLDEFRRAKNITAAKFEKSIGYGYNSFGNALARGSSLKDETITLIIKIYPELNLRWLFLGLGNMMNANDEVIEIEGFGEPNLYYLYDLMDQLNSDHSKEIIVSKLKKEVIRLYSNHLELKNDLQKIKDLSENI